MDDDLDALLDDVADEMVASAPKKGHDDLLDEAADDILGELRHKPPSSSSTTSSSMSSSRAVAPVASGGAVTSRLIVTAALSKVLPSTIMSRWAPVLEADAASLQRMKPPRPPSHAYRSFSQREAKRAKGGGGGGDAGGAAGGGDSDAMEGVEGGKEEADDGKTPQTSVVIDLILRASTRGGFKDTEGLRRALKTDPDLVQKLELLFQHQAASDLRERVRSDPDYDPARFLATAARIVGRRS